MSLINPTRPFKTALGLGLALAAAAAAMPIEFVYNNRSYGTMDVTVRNAGTLQVQFTGTAVPGVTDFQVTGFGFTFNELYRMGNLVVSNPADNLHPDDQNNLDWIRLTNLNALPQPTNSTEVRKGDFDFGVTEGKANNLNPPGIHPGQTDFYYLGGFRDLTAATDLSEVVELTGIRIQAINPGGGSLFLVGDGIPPAEPPPAVPEPGTLALMGMGLLGIAVAARRRRK
jgi:hypothetical protein